MNLTISSRLVERAFLRTGFSCCVCCCQEKVKNSQRADGSYHAFLSEPTRCVDAPPWSDPRGNGFFGGR